MLHSIILEVTMDTAPFIFTIIGVLIVGLAVGFVVTKTVIQKQIQKNPPINEKMIRVMFQQMGRKPSEAQIRAIMASMKKNQ